MSLVPGSQLTPGPNSSVLWSRNGVLVRKFSFPDTPPVAIKAVFVSFQPTNQHENQHQPLQSGPAANSIAILASEYLHTYHLKGSFNIISLPFAVSSISACPYGLILSRNFDAPGSSSDADNDLAPKFYLMSNPLLDLIPINASSLTSIYFSEEPVYFGNISDTPYCVTYDSFRQEVNIYHIRSSQNASLSYHRVFDESIRHAKVQSNSSQLTLTSIGSFSLYATLDHLSVSTCNLDNNTAIIISNSLNNTISVLIFNSPDHPSSATPALVKSFEIPGSSPLLVPDITKRNSILIVLSSPSTFYFFDPFFNLRSFAIKFPTHWKSITKLGAYNYGASDLIFAYSDSNKFYNISLPVSPKDDLAAKIFLGLSKLLDLKVFRVFNFTWSLLLNSHLVLSEWEALVASLVGQLYPYDSLKSVLESSLFSDYMMNSFTLHEILPTALDIINSFDDGDKITSELCPHIINFLHYIREEFRLEYTSRASLSRIDKLLTYLSHWSGWNDSWKSYYGFLPNTPQQAIEEYTLPFPQPPNIIDSLASVVTPSATPIYFSLLSEIYSEPSLDELTPLCIKVLKLFTVLTQTPKDFSSMDFTKEQLNSFTGGIQHIIFEFFSQNSDALATLNDTKLWDMLGRDDLLFSALSPKLRQLATSHKDTAAPKYTAALVGTVGDLEFLSAWDEQTESDRNKISRLIFSTDRRFYEVSRILQSSKPKPITVIQTPSMSEVEALNKQEETYIASVLRTCTVPMGRAAFHYSARKPLVTEKYPIPKLNFTAIVKPRETTLTLTKNLVSEENLSWGYFHNGVASGLSLSKDSISVNGNWISFNKPARLNSQHAGFLLGIGLNGHLSRLEEWHIYNYLGPKHSHTSIALLIGMAASNLRSMDTKLTKVLGVHIFALLPPGSNDLNVSVEVQTAGVIGMGLLYLESSHRRMTETFLGELEGRTRIHTEESIRIHTNESYKLAAGFALGLVNLGKGSDLTGLNDVKIVERLMSRAVSPRDVQTSQLEISVPGSIAALLLMFLQSGNAEIAKKLAPPENQEAYDYIRPDLLLIRTVASQVIMWDDIGCTDDWVDQNIPKAVALTVPESSLAYTTDTVTYFYIKAGLCMAMALKHASTGNIEARDCIIKTLDTVCKLTEHTVTQHDQQLAKQSLLHIQNSLCLSLSIVMSGTGDLEALRRLRRLCLKTRKDTCGVNIATNLALGILFLGGGQFRFGSDCFSVAALFIASYPVFPRVLVDNTSYLQPLRYFWALAARPNCVVVREVETGHPCVVTLRVAYKSGATVELQTPCAIPNLEGVECVCTASDDYGSVQIDLSAGGSSPLMAAFLKTLTIYVRRESTLISKATDSFQQHGHKYKTSGMPPPPQASSLCSILSKVNILADIDLEKFTQSSTLLLQRAFETSQDGLLFANMSAAKSPKTNEDLWNMRLVAAFQEYVRSNGGATTKEQAYTNLKVDEMKTLLWKWKSERTRAA